MYRVDFSYLENSLLGFFFDTKVIVFFNRFFLILENFDVQQLIGRPDTNPNFKKQNGDYRLDFDMKF